MERISLNNQGAVHECTGGCIDVRQETGSSFTEAEIKAVTDYPSAISQDIGLTPSVITLKLIFYIGYPKYVDDCGEYVRAVAKNGQTRWQVCIGVVFSWLLFSHEQGSKDHPSPCAAFWVTCQGLIKVTKSLCA